MAEGRRALNLTPQEIEEFLQEYFGFVGTRQYVGMRYEPLFGRKGEESIKWDNSAPYEPLTIVLHQGNSFTSRQYVPAGVDIDNAHYWAETGNFNGQIEAYREEVLALKASVDNAIESIEDIDETIDLLSKDTIALAMRSMEFAPYTRSILKNQNDTFHSFQVSTMDEQEQFIYAITPYSASDQATTKESFVRVINPQTGETITAKELPVGHGRSLTVKNDIMLTCNQYAASENEWIAIDISNKIDPTLVSRGTFDGQHIFWTDEGAACYAGSNKIKFFDVTYDNNGYPTSFIENGRTLTFAQGIKGEEQSFQYWNGFIIISSTLPDAIIVIDATNGNAVSYIELEKSYGFLHTAECESAFVINGHMYFSNNAKAPSESDGIENLQYCLFRCDFLNQKGQWYDYWLKKSYQGARGGNIHVSGERPLPSSVSSDGSIDLPYWFVEDALVSYSAKKLIGDGITQLNRYLSCEFTANEYPYEILLSNFDDIVMSLNGISGDSTRVPCIFVFNTSLILNRIAFEGVIDSDKTGSVYPVSLMVTSGKVRSTANLTFLNEELDAIDILADILSDVECESATRKVVARRGSTVRAKSISSFSATDGAKVESMLVAPSPFMAKFEAGQNQAATEQWINFINPNGSMNRLYISNTYLRLRHYEDATQTGTGHYTDIWEIRPNT